MCSEPVGEGAKRVTTWGSEGEEVIEGRSVRAALIPSDAAKPSLGRRIVDAALVEDRGEGLRPLRLVLDGVNFARSSAIDLWITPKA